MCRRRKNCRGQGSQPNSLTQLGRPWLTPCKDWITEYILNVWEDQTRGSGGNIVAALRDVGCAHELLSENVRLKGSLEISFSSRGIGFRFAAIACNSRQGPCARLVVWDPRGKGSMGRRRGAFWGKKKRSSSREKAATVTTGARTREALDSYDYGLYYDSVNARWKCDDLVLLENLSNEEIVEVSSAASVAYPVWCPSTN